MQQMAALPIERQIMDPWRCDVDLVKISADQDSFEDNFHPTVGETLPDSEKYLAALEKKLYNLKSRPSVLKQLKEKKELCMRELLQSTIETEDSFYLDNAIDPSLLIRAVNPERQALTAGEIAELLKYDYLQKQADSEECDSASR